DGPHRRHDQRFLTHLRCQLPLYLPGLFRRDVPRMQAAVLHGKFPRSKPINPCLYSGGRILLASARILLKTAPSEKEKLPCSTRLGLLPCGRPPARSESLPAITSRRSPFRSAASVRELSPSADEDSCGTGRYSTGPAKAATCPTRSL